MFNGLWYTQVKVLPRRITPVVFIRDTAFFSLQSVRKKARRTAVMPYSAITAQYTLPCFIFCSVSFSRSPLEQLEAEKEERELKLKKMQQEMEQVFEMKVKEKKKKLKDSETEVRVVGWARFNPKKPDIKIKIILFSLALFISHANSREKLLKYQ